MASTSIVFTGVSDIKGVNPFCILQALIKRQWIRCLSIETVSPEKSCNDQKQQAGVVYIVT